MTLCGTSPVMEVQSVARNACGDRSRGAGIIVPRGANSRAEGSLCIHSTELPGVAIVESAPQSTGDGGSLTCLFDAAMFADHGLGPRVVQCGILFTSRAGTLRGLHYQRAPYGEGRLIRCTRGRIFNVVIDLRVHSRTYGCWTSVELSAIGATSTLFVPRGCAHGFQTLEDSSELHYQVDAPYVADAVAGVRWDDPAFAIPWPEPPGDERTLSERDRSYPDFALGA